MPITIRNTTSFSDFASANNINSPVQSSTRIGDLVVAYLFKANSDIPVTAVGRYVRTFAESTNTTLTIVVYRAQYHGSSGNSFGATWTNSCAIAVGTVVYAGVDECDPLGLGYPIGIDAIGYGTAISSIITYTSSQALIVPQKNLIVSIGGINAAASPGTPSGFTTRGSTNLTYGSQLSDQLLEAGPIGTVTSTSGGSGSNEGVLLSLRPAVTPQPRDFVNQVSITTGQTSSTPASTNIGDLNIAIINVTVPAATTITTPSGWTLIYNSVYNSGGNQIAGYYKIATASGSETVTWTFTGGGTADIQHTCWHGALSASPIDISGIGSTTSSTSVTAPSITPTFNGDTLLFVGYSASSNTWTAPAGMTGITSGTTVRTFSAWESHGSTQPNSVVSLFGTSTDGTSTRVATLNSSSPNVGLLIAIRGANPAKLSATARSGASAVTSLAITVPTPIANNNLMLLQIYWSAGVTSISPGAGWTQTQSDLTAPVFKSYWKLASSEPSTYTWSWTTSSDVTAIMSIIDGYATLDTDTYTKTVSSATTTLTNVTSAKDGDLILFSGMNAAASVGTYTTGTGDIEALDANVARNTFVAWELQGAAGSTLTKSITGTQTANNVGYVAAINRSAKSYAVDACFSIQEFHTLHVDAKLILRPTRTYNVDAVLKRIAQAYFVDAVLKKTETSTYQVDSYLIKSRVLRTYSVDATFVASGPKFTLASSTDATTRITGHSIFRSQNVLSDGTMVFVYHDPNQSFPNQLILAYCSDGSTVNTISSTLQSDNFSAGFGYSAINVIVDNLDNIFVVGTRSTAQTIAGKAFTKGSGYTWTAQTALSGTDTGAVLSSGNGSGDWVGIWSNDGGGTNSKGHLLTCAIARSGGFGFDVPWYATWDAGALLAGSGTMIVNSATAPSFLGANETFQNNFADSDGLAVIDLAPNGAVGTTSGLSVRSNNGGTTTSATVTVGSWAVNSSGALSTNSSVGTISVSNVPTAIHIVRYGSNAYAIFARGTNGRWACSTWTSSGQQTALTEVSAITNMPATSGGSPVGAIQLDPTNNNKIWVILYLSGTISTNVKFAVDVSSGIVWDTSFSTVAVLVGGGTNAPAFASHHYPKGSRGYYLVEDNNDTGAAYKLLGNYISYAYIKTHSVDAYLVKRFTVSYLTDAVLKKTETSTYLVDADLKKTLNRTYTVDADLKKTLTVTHQVDAKLVKRITRTYNVDSVLKKTETSTYSVDADLKKTIKVTYLVDSYLKKILTRTYNVDAVLKKTLSVTYSVDADLLKKNETSTYQVDAELKKTLSVNHSVDAITRIGPFYVNSNSVVSGNTCVMSKPTGTIQNYLMIASITIKTTQSVTTVPSGWALVRVDSTSSGVSDIKTYIYSKTAGASEPATYTWIIT